MTRPESSRETTSFLLRGATVLSGAAGRAGRSRAAAAPAPAGATDVLIREGKVALVGDGAGREGRQAGAAVVDLEGLYLAPGFVDLHTHGGAGIDFVSASEDEFRSAMGHYLSHGVTALLVSLYPGEWEESLETVRRVADYIARGVGRGVPLGIHLEGPFLSPERPGALPVENFRPCSTRDAGVLLDAASGAVRTMTVAPELPGAPELIRYLEKRGVVAAFGHSAADYETTRRAVAGGVRYATHLFNAMTGMHHRRPGAVTALLEDPDVAVEVISDGYHVAVPVLRLVRRAKPADRIILVSDSVHPCGLRDGRYRFAGAEVILEKGRIRRTDGTLAGSALTLERAVALQVTEVGVSPEDAVCSASAAPARAIGIDRSRGRIRRGARADLVALDEKLRVQATWLGGGLVHSRDEKRFGEALSLA